MLYGGGPKGDRTDPRSGKARQRAYAAATRSRTQRMWSIGIGAATILIVGIVMIVVLTQSGEDTPTTTIDPDAVFGMLDCSPGVVVGQRLEIAEGSTRDLLQAAEPSVVSVARDPSGMPRTWGYDATGTVVAAIENPDDGEYWAVYTCSG